MGVPYGSLTNTFAQCSHVQERKRVKESADGETGYGTWRATSTCIPVFRQAGETSISEQTVTVTSRIVNASSMTASISVPWLSPENTRRVPFWGAQTRPMTPHKPDHASFAVKRRCRCGQCGLGCMRHARQFRPSPEMTVSPRIAWQSHRCLAFD